MEILKPILLDFINVQKAIINVEENNYINKEEKIIAIRFFNRQDEFLHPFLMDKKTAIKFAKTLRTEINKITESEVKNG